MDDIELLCGKCSVVDVEYCEDCLRYKTDKCDFEKT